MTLARADISIKQIAEQTMSASWLKKLHAEFDQPYIKNIESFLSQEITQGKSIFPPTDLWFSAFKSSTFDQVKVIILGQDPYHGAGQAHGLSFSVLPGTRVPPSLMNIYKELNTDLAMEIPQHGYLQGWADQGVLLLNTTLTVEESQAGSHQKQGWESFTDQVITMLDQQREGLVFMLWGSHAQKKAVMIDGNKHLILNAPHPSPLSAYRGFFGCRHFSQANKYLKKVSDTKIDWSLLADIK